ncbi:FAD-dependent oxidoreductase [Candidatus Woesearchaeota archaeon]|nr:MAG: FAD-dependent oxidoreductase [Candidatus Woesearchaeota archaeon]
MDCTVVEIIQETHDCRTFVFKPEKMFSYVPGQFIIMHLKNTEMLLQRSYSFSSAPDNADTFSITVKEKLDGRFTPLLWNLKIGDVLEGRGPFGSFKLDREPKPNGRYVFIAGGAGITAPWSMIQNLLNQKTPFPITLIFGNRSMNDIIFLSKLHQLCESNPNFKLVHVLEKKPDNWNCYQGYITKTVIAEAVPNYADCMFALCGPPVMITAVVKELQSLGVPPDQIRQEKW